MNTIDTSFAGRNHLGTEVTVGDINSGKAPTFAAPGTPLTARVAVAPRPGVALNHRAASAPAPTKRTRPAYLTLVVDNGPVPAKRSHVGFGGGLVYAVS